MNPLPAFAAPGSKHELEEGETFTPRFGPDGLITALAVDADSGAVLMLAHMNAESLARTLATGEVWYWSRSRAELWHKGATSGQIQTLVEMRVDCDQDALLLRVRVGGDGGCCHTGRRDCFYRGVVYEAGSGTVTLVSRPS
ncbi:phosphoribosyl-AMP cyclohydrolase [Methylobacterium currus]|uniref:Phosphoribosyl-AMP cyclohydrolase n=1 Tax=Methylobacterium currus TaxID=2051553 RepID=A0A2R4WVR6_9HYPH|nr:phosphoribosyl-AMP cyclohydrolase [Methylobacterium currus]AWB25619.1 phosphoribosyl-AMP cyclohydrolase [Methylobacterium currus]UHC19324.1 phosphoribosyl-AMP cyclohydrolase [Methylobacterium currus]